MVLGDFKEGVLASFEEMGAESLLRHRSERLQANDEFRRVGDACQGGIDYIVE